MKRTRAALLLVDQIDATRLNFELSCAQARRGVAYAHYFGSACCRGGTARLTTHREHEAHAVLHESNTRLALLRKSVGRVFTQIRSVLASPQTRAQRCSRSQRRLIGLVCHNACPYGSAPHVSARPQPRVCSARRSSAGGRPRCQLSRPQVQPLRLVKLLRVMLRVDGVDGV